MAVGDTMGSKTLAVRSITELANGKVRLEFRNVVEGQELDRQRSMSGNGPIGNTVYQEDVEQPDGEPYLPGEVVTISLTRGEGV